MNNIVLFPSLMALSCLIVDLPCEKKVWISLSAADVTSNHLEWPACNVDDVCKHLLILLLANALLKQLNILFRFQIWLSLSSRHRALSANRMDSYDDKLWYSAVATRDSAVAMLKGEPCELSITHHKRQNQRVLLDGAFVVRPSSQPRCLALSHVQADRQIGHVLVCENGVKSANATRYASHR
jgi:hypothetical protein